MDRDQKVDDRTGDAQNTDFDISADLEATNNFYKQMNEQNKELNNKSRSIKTAGIAKKSTGNFKENDINSQDNMMSDEPDLGFDYSNIEQKDTLKNYQNSKTKVSDQKTMINSFANYTNQGSVIGLKSYQNIPRKIMKKETNEDQKEYMQNTAKVEDAKCDNKQSERSIKKKEEFIDENIIDEEKNSSREKKTERNKESARSEKKEEQKDAPKAGGSKGLFGGMLSGLNQDDIGDIEGPARENWQFCVFQVRKRKYNILKNGISDKLNIPLGPNDETLIMCLNFSDKELKTLLVDMLKVNTIIYYECMLLSPVDKVYEFADGSTFYNMIINQERFQDTPYILRMIRKDNFAVVIMNQDEGDNFLLSTEIATKFKFKEIKKMKFPKLFKRRQMLKTQAKLNGKTSKGDSDNKKSAQNNTSFEAENAEVDKEEVGKVVIQRIKTIMPMNDQQITIDYLMFWISSEGLKRIENFINLKLLSEITELQERSKNLGVNEKKEFLQDMDIFENLYIGAVNAKGSKEKYFDKIIGLAKASSQFRFLIRHLKSRMTNLSNTTFVIERKIKIARNSFQMSIDTKMTENAEKLDKLMRQFSLISVMFLPLTVITGMWGMNCKVPYVFGEDTNNLDCFWGLCGAMGGIIVFCTVFFKTMGWM